MDCSSATNDIRVGGRFTSGMEAGDGSFGFDFSGTYDEITVHKRIAYTMEDGRKAIQILRHRKKARRSPPFFDAEQQHPEEMRQQGWQAIFSQLKKYAEELPRSEHKILHLTQNRFFKTLKLFLNSVK